MCGIFGVITTEKGFNHGKIKKITQNLLKVSESRGKESSGVAVLSKEEIYVLKLAMPAHDLTSSKEFEKLFSTDIIAAIGHARLVTNGSLEDNRNNQPVIKDGIVGIHNGIVVNVDNLWKAHHDLKRLYEVDTEVILSLVRNFYAQTSNLAEAIRLAFDQIEGAVSIALTFEDVNALAIATNTGSLYLLAEKDICVFASEYNFLIKILPWLGLKEYKSSSIKQVAPGSGFIFDLQNLKKIKIDLKKINAKPGFSATPRKIRDLSDYPIYKPPKFEIKVTEKIKNDFDKFRQKINKLKRCTRCILPETIPFIEFDQQGVCSYCRSFEKFTTKGKKGLEKILSKYRTPGKPDCLVTFSGGRDSSYGLHYLKKVLKMNPITFTYDWGMITDLGRRNQARLTGKLGVEQILVSADIQVKRENIRKNVLAWLTKPDLGTVPLFMAGDKQYFYFANKISQELGIKLIILCINPYEKTDFKFGFCGVKPDAKISYRINFANKMKMAFYYAKAYISNPTYINTSILDTLFAFGSYYFVNHDYLPFYEYIDWDERIIEKTLVSEYNWEISPETLTTWRIGDGTASFYNYIYYVLAGFTENDTFRSNQIRQGVLTREQALKRVKIENQPRWHSIQWYCDTIGIDSQKTLETINKSKKLYKV